MHLLNDEPITEQEDPLDSAVSGFVALIVFVGLIALSLLTENKEWIW